MKLLGIETSTDTLSIAVQCGDAVFEHCGRGGATASTNLIPAIEALMGRAGVQYRELDAIVFGRGPGSFTGLRTACSVAQGLALGANIKVVPVDTLLAVAQEALCLARAQSFHPQRILAALDARMGELYVCGYECQGALRASSQSPLLKKPQDILQDQCAMPAAIAGNIRPHCDGQLPPSALALPYIACLPSARALLALAPGMIAAGGLVQAQDALPLYIRDKVALTTAQRQAHN